ncbi:MAG: helix-turn-helix domain-containing protein [Patescibacteria group bacterium]|jgi:carbohydrate diacid regulator
MGPIPLFWEEHNHNVTKIIGDYDLISSLDHLCISSSNPRRIGKKVVIPGKYVKLPAVREIEIGGAQCTLMPINYQDKHVAFLLINKHFDSLENYLPLIQSLAELSVAHYVEKSKYTPDSTDVFVSNLLNHDAYDLSVYRTEARSLGYNFKMKRIAIAIHLANFSYRQLFSPNHTGFEREETIKKWKKRIEYTINSFFTSSKDIITAYIGEDTFAVFKTVEKDEDEKLGRHIKLSHRAIFSPLRDASISDITVGFSNAYSGLIGIIKSSKEAKMALSLGNRTKGPNHSYHIDDFGLLSLIAHVDEETQKRFAQRILGKITDSNILLTLEILLEENFNISHAAERLKVHRNTIIYRIHQIEDILGYDPRSFDSVVNFKIALLINKRF